MATFQLPKEFNPDFASPQPAIPIDLVEIDSSDYFSRGLLAYIVGDGNGLFDIKNQYRLASSDATKHNLKFGKEGRYLNVTADGGDLLTSPPLELPGDWTITWLCTTTGDITGMVCGDPTSGSNIHWIQMGNSDDDVWTRTGDTNSAVQTITAVKRTDLVWRSVTRRGTTIDYYAGGKQATELTGQPTTTFLATAITSGIANDGFDFLGNLYAIIFHDYALRRPEVEAFHKGPKRALRPKFELYLVGESGADVTSVLTGTMLDTVNEDDITTGGKTIIITLTGDTFKAAGTGPIGSTADTQALIDGFDAASSPTNGWNNEVRDKALTSEVVRTSDTVATWTVAAQAGYDVSAQETITGTIPTDVLVTGAGAITATPTFTVDQVAGGLLLTNRSIANYGGMRQ